MVPVYVIASIRNWVCEFSVVLPDDDVQQTRAREIVGGEDEDESATKTLFLIQFKKEC